MVSTLAPQTETGRTQSAAATVLRHALWRWHLLSLDAPTVATLWTWSIARSVHLSLTAAELLSMFGAVWVLYAADRLLDARALAFRTTPSLAGLEARHLFHHEHRTAFRAGIALVCLCLAGLLPRALESAELARFLILGALLIAWFLVIHSLSGEMKRPLPKEFVVGPFFAAAVFLPAAVRAPQALPHLWLPAIAFAALCSLNCVFIAAWERAPAHPMTRAAARGIVFCACLLAVASGGYALCGPADRVVLLPVAISTLLLLAVHAARRRLDRTTLRALADVALLTPILAAPWLR